MRKLLVSLHALALALLTASMTFASPVETRSDLLVRLEAGVAPVERLADVVHGWGRVVRRERTGELRLQLVGAVSPSEARARLERRGIVAVREVPPTIPRPAGDLYSAFLLLNHFERREGEDRAWRALNPDLAGEGTRLRRLEPLDYLGAWRYFIEQRAYPYDRVDWDAYDRAHEHKRQMPSALESRRIRETLGVSRGEGPRSLSMEDSTNGLWEFLGPTNLGVPYRTYWGLPPVNGRVNGVTFHPTNPSTIFLASAGGGAWRSDDAGINWAPLSDSWQYLQTTEIAIHPAEPDTIYVGTGDFPGRGPYTMGIMKSTDGGQTWSNIGRSAFGGFAVSKILIDPDNPSRLLVTTGRGRDFYGRVWLSTDAGATWQVSNNNQVGWSGASIGAPFQNGSRYWYIAGGATGGQVYRTSNKGGTWTKLNPPVSADFLWCLDIAASKTDPDIVYLLSPQERKIFKSTDAGTTWSDITAGFPNGTSSNANYNWSQYWYDWHLTLSTRNTTSGPVDVLYVGLIDIVQSPDAGATWRTVGGPTYSSGALTHNDQHCMAIHPNDPNVALVGNDGGIYRLNYNPSTGSITWGYLSRTLGITQFYKADYHPTNPNIILGGTQDNATPYSNNDLANWRAVGGGDGGFTAINPANPSIQYCTSQNLGVYRTTNGWSSSSTISPSTGTDRKAFIAPIVLDANQPHLLYAGTDHLWRWNNNTASWTARLGGQKLAGSTGHLLAIAVAPSDSNRIYTGSNDGHVWMTTNAGSSWTQINTGSPGLPNRAVTSISVNPANASDILVGVSGTGTPHLYRCSNTLAGTRVYSSVSGSGSASLPDVPLNEIARDFAAPATTWWVATDIGVFMTENSGATWFNATEPLGLPNVQVNGIRAVSGTGYMNVATYGRGIWRLRLPHRQVTGVGLSPTVVRAGGVSTGTVTLSGPAPTGGYTVHLLSSDPSVATVPASVTVAAGSSTTTFGVQAQNVSSSGIATISASGGGQTVHATLQVTVPIISGQILFGDFVGAAPTEATFEFRAPGSTTPFETRTVPLASDGTFQIVGAPAQQLDLSVKIRTWLRRTLPLDLRVADAIGLSVAMVNGDVNGDNAINLGDFSLLSAAFRSRPGDANWNPMADLNGDGVVNLADFSILSANFRRVGDP
jgi:hypothetical protein